MKRILFTLAIIAPFLCFGQQKIKTIKNPVGWTYEVAPQTPLSENLKTYTIDVKTNLNPMDADDETAWSMQVDESDYKVREKLRQEAIQDTLANWSERYLALHQQPYVESSANPDFTIVLQTETFQVENTQLDVDYDDDESVLCKINATARIIVKTSEGNILLDEQMVYLLDDTDGKTPFFKLKQFLLNPVFKLKFKLKKKPEKKRELLERKLEKLEAFALEYFFKEGGSILKNHFLTQTFNAYGATFGVKNKEYEKITEYAENVKSDINSLSAFSKKKRQSHDQIKPSLTSAIVDWQTELVKIGEPEMQDILNYNIALASLILEDMDAVKLHISNIPEYEALDKKTIFEGSFTYYLRGLADALELKEKYGPRAVIYQP
ncbi:hypothetical protein [Flagellimonas iocasae]|uniref:Uncharacterized protein n=1 Tax=Flagellimonas iocasae TaxID=2055905 RepID=A0ABW4XTM8_9FLAO